MKNALRHASLAALLAAGPLACSSTLEPTGTTSESLTCVSVPHMGWPRVRMPYSTTSDPVFPSARVVTIVPSNIDTTLRQQLFAFGGAVAQGSWLMAVGSEYGLMSAGAHAEVVGSAIDGAPPCGTGWSKTEAEAYIEGVIAANASIAHDGSTIYVLHMPQGCTVLDSEDSDKTNSFHHSFSSGGDAWALVQPKIKASATSAEVLDDYTIAASHEIIEAVTDTGQAIALRVDPFVALNQQSPWVVESPRQHSEVGDLCGPTRIRLTEAAGTFAYSRSWSNLAAQGGGDPCVPAVSDVYYNTTPDMSFIPSGTKPGWKTIAPTGSTGATVTFSIRGWVDTSQGCIFGQWNLAAESIIPDSNTNGIPPTSVSVSPGSIGNGGSATLTIEVPPNTPTGHYLAVKVISTPTSVTADQDQKHEQMYGVYVQ